MDHKSLLLLYPSEKWTFWKCWRQIVILLIMIYSWTLLCTQVVYASTGTSLVMFSVDGKLCFWIFLRWPVEIWTCCEVRPPHPPVVWGPRWFYLMPSKCHGSPGRLRDKLEDCHSSAKWHTHTHTDGRGGGGSSLGFSASCFTLLWSLSFGGVQLHRYVHVEVF